MKNKSNAGPGLIVALGSPSDDAGKMGVGSAGGGALDAPGAGALPGDVNALSDAANTDTVPVSMLAMPDDQEQMQPPDVGDVVNYQVTGKVVAIEGDYATVQRQSINGQELPGAEDGSPETGDGDSGGDDAGGQSLRNDAASIGMLS
jgi:hypothetical protein